MGSQGVKTSKNGPSNRSKANMSSGVEEPQERAFDSMIARLSNMGLVREHPDVPGELQYCVLWNLL